MSVHSKDRSQKKPESSKSNESQSTTSNPLNTKIIRIENQIYNIDNVVGTMRKKQDRLRQLQNNEVPQTESIRTAPLTLEGDELYKFVGDGDNPKKKYTTIVL